MHLGPGREEDEDDDDGAGGEVRGVRAELVMKTTIDPVAARLIETSKIKTLFLGVNETVKGAGHSGTTVVPMGE